MLYACVQDVSRLKSWTDCWVSLLRLHDLYQSGKGVPRLKIKQQAINTGMYRFSKNLAATSEFYTPVHKI